MIFKKTGKISSKNISYCINIIFIRGKYQTDIIMPFFALQIFVIPNLFPYKFIPILVAEYSLRRGERGFRGIP